MSRSIIWIVRYSGSIYNNAQIRKTLVKILNLLFTDWISNSFAVIMNAILLVDRKKIGRRGYSERVKPTDITLQQLSIEKERKSVRERGREKRKIYRISIYIFVPSLKSYTLYYTAAMLPVRRIYIYPRENFTLQI